MQSINLCCWSHSTRFHGRVTNKRLLHAAVVNTGTAGPLYYPYSWWAITPTTLGPKTRLSSVSIRPFTPGIKPLLYLHASECMSVFGIWDNRGPLCPPLEWDGAGGAGCMQNGCSIITPSLPCTGGHLSCASRAEGRSRGSMEDREGGRGQRVLATLSLYVRSKLGFYGIHEQIKNKKQTPTYNNLDLSMCNLFEIFVFKNFIRSKFY